MKHQNEWTVDPKCMNSEKLEHQVIFICGGMWFLILNLFQFVPHWRTLENTA